MSRKNRDLREPLRGKKSFRGKKLTHCRWCNAKITGLRRSFCSDDCVHEHKLRSDVGYMRKAVFNRDRGICAICKRDCEKLKSEALNFLEVSEEVLKKFLKELKYPERRIKRFIKDKGISLWDADHIIPVVSGGAGCGLEGMRTLCVPCHDFITHHQRRMIVYGISDKQTILWDDNQLYTYGNKK